MMRLLRLLLDFRLLFFLFFSILKMTVKLTPLSSFKNKPSLQSAKMAEYIYDS